MEMGNFLPTNPDMDGYGYGRTGWSGVGLKILPHEGLYGWHDVRAEGYALYRTTGSHETRNVSPLWGTWSDVSGRGVMEVGEKSLPIPGLQ